jgi:hypothetical protein
MLHSKRSLEGELLIDHRASPGLTAEDVAGTDIPVVGKGEVYESAVVTCGHCACVVVMNPLRTRERGWCSRCDRYMCDACAYVMQKTLQCNTVKRRLDQAFEDLERGVSPQLLTKL